MLASLFTVIFFGMKRVYPNLRGVNTIAFSFLFGVLGTLLLGSRGSISYFASVIVANSFIFGSYIFLYRGVLRFIESRRNSPLPWVAAVASLFVLYYYSQIHDSIVPRIVAASITIGLIRSLLAIELFRKASASTSPTTMRVFGGSVFFFAATSFDRAVLTVLHGAPANYLESDAIQTANLALGVVSICLTGLFFLVLASSELISRSKDESQRDQLTGALNRRGIEDRLSVQLGHVANGNQRLSIALIDIDHFKSINDRNGHAAGDAAIRDVARAMFSNLRRYDCVARYGGDEFLVLLPHTSCADALTLADRLIAAVSKIDAVEEGRPITLSIGVTEAVPTDDVFAIIARADKALYQAKNDGRNCRRYIVKENLAPDAASAAPKSSFAALIRSAAKS